MNMPIEAVDAGVSTLVGTADNTAQMRGAAATGTAAARNGTAVTPGSAGPDFGPAATFTPSQELARLAATQRTSVHRAAESLAAAGNPNGSQVGASAGSAFVPADSATAKQFTMYNSTGTAVPLSQAVAAGAVPVAPPAATPTTPQPPPVSQAIPATPSVP
jgi:hypothetical protein